MKLFAGVLVLLLASAAVVLATDVEAGADTESQAEAQAAVLAQTEALTAAVNEAEAVAQASTQAQGEAQSGSDTEAQAEAEKPSNKKKKDDKKKGDGKTFKPVMIDRDTRHAMYHQHSGVRYADGGQPHVIHFPPARRVIQRIIGLRRPRGRSFRIGGFPIRVFGVRHVHAPRPPRKEYFEPIYEDEHAAIQHIKRHIEEARRPRAWRPFVVIGRHSRHHGYGLPIRGWIRRSASASAFGGPIVIGRRRRAPRRGAAGFSLPEFPRMPLSARRHIARADATARHASSPMQRRLRALKSWLASLPSVKQLPDGRLRIRHRLFARGVRGSLSALDWAMERMARLSARLSAAQTKLQRSSAKGERLAKNKALLAKIRAGMQRLALQIARVEAKVRAAGVKGVPVEPLAVRKSAAAASKKASAKADDFDDEFDLPFYKAPAPRLTRKASKPKAKTKSIVDVTKKPFSAGYGFAGDDSWRTYADDGEDDDD